MAWILGIVILALITAFSVWQLTRSNDAAMRVDAWRPKHIPQKTDPDQT